MTSPDKPQCPTCGGKKYVVANRERMPIGHPILESYKQCPDCKGTGEAPQAPPSHQGDGGQAAPMPADFCLECGKEVELPHDCPSDTPPTSFAAELLRILTSYDQLSVPADAGNIYLGRVLTEQGQEAMAAITAAHEHDMEQVIYSLHDSIMRQELQLGTEPDVAFNYARIHRWIDEQRARIKGEA